MLYYMVLIIFIVPLLQWQINSHQVNEIVSVTDVTGLFGPESISCVSLDKSSMREDIEVWDI